jgi:molybdopterin converting factor small subunit
MNVHVRIPPTLRSETGGEREVPVVGSTVAEVLEDLTRRYPELSERIYANGGLARFVNAYVDGEDVRTLQGLETPVKDGSTVILLPAMAGGAPPARR